MPMYDLECAKCGKVKKDVICKSPLKAGESTSELVTEVAEDGIGTVVHPVTCDCGSKKWKRVREMHLNARCDRAWTASCRFSKKS